MITAPPPIMASLSGGTPQSSIAAWLMRHPEFGGAQHITDPAPQAFQNANPNAAFQRPFGPARAIGFLGALMNGQHPPRFDAWRDQRIAQGLPYTGPQFQPQQVQQQNPSSYGSGLGEPRFGLVRSY